MVWQCRDEQERQLWRRAGQAGKFAAISYAAVGLGGAMLGASDAITGTGVPGLFAGALVSAGGISLLAVGALGAICNTFEFNGNSGKALLRHFKLS